MRLTLRWSEREEEGRLSKTESERLLAAAEAKDILAMDMVKDGLAAIAALYNEMLDRFTDPQMMPGEHG